MSTFDVTLSVVGGFTTTGGGGESFQRPWASNELPSAHVTQLAVNGGPLGPGSEIRGPTIAAGGAGCSRRQASSPIPTGGVRGLLALP